MPTTANNPTQPLFARSSGSAFSAGDALKNSVAAGYGTAPIPVSVRETTMNKDQSCCQSQPGSCNCCEPNTCVPSKGCCDCGAACTGCCQPSYGNSCTLL